MFRLIQRKRNDKPPIILNRTPYKKLRMKTQIFDSNANTTKRFEALEDGIKVGLLEVEITKAKERKKNGCNINLF